MPGGTAAIRQPWRMTAAYLPDAAGDVRRRHADRWDDVVTLARRGVNAPLTSSAGRLFDAVAALIGLRDTINYEGQAAIELEQLADVAEPGGYPAGFDEPLVLRGGDLVAAAAEDLARGVAPAVIAARFHNGVVTAVVTACTRMRDDTGIADVALSGGVFQNVLLTDRLVTRLTDAGFRVLTHSRVPANDGGISLGQAVVAAARDRAGHI
jgi:hydrogenase maturation protein HypF